MQRYGPLHDHTVGSLVLVHTVDQTASVSRPAASLVAVQVDNQHARVVRVEMGREVVPVMRVGLAEIELSQHACPGELTSLRDNSNEVRWQTIEVNPTVRTDSSLIPNVTHFCISPSTAGLIFA